MLLKILESLQQTKEGVAPRRVPNIKKMQKELIIGTYIVCILGMLPCCHALWSWKKFCKSVSSGKSSCLFSPFCSIYLLERNVPLCRNRESECEPNQLPAQWVNLQRAQKFPATPFRKTCSLRVRSIPICAQDEWIQDLILLTTMVAPALGYWKHVVDITETLACLPILKLLNGFLSLSWEQ